jgi:hypothetical protein
MVQKDDRVGYGRSMEGFDEKSKGNLGFGVGVFATEDGDESWPVWIGEYYSDYAGLALMVNSG